MKIQIITENTIETIANATVNTYASPESLDIYNVNIFDLRDGFWRHDAKNTTSVNLAKDIKHIKNMITTATNKNNIIVLPQNSSFKYDYSSRNYGGPKNLLKNEDLKNCFSTIIKITKDNFVDYDYSLGYELNKTILQNKEYKSDFYINNTSEESTEVVSKSNKSNKITSLSIEDKVIITTLDILENGLLYNYLESVGIINNKAAIPEWLSEVEIFNDKELKKEKEAKEKELTNIQNELSGIESSLSENNEHKAILYETGTKLSTKVNSILGEIFGINAKMFKDVYEEDFLLKLDTITFIVEIKGIVHNVNGKNVSEAFNHVQVYLDDVLENDKEEVKGLLIVANQREINPENRVKINERQIKIAKRNEMLIIKTEDLLKIYEKYLSGKLTVEEITKMFRERMGLLTL